MYVCRSERSVADEAGWPLRLSAMARVRADSTRYSRHGEKRFSGETLPLIFHLKVIKQTRLDMPPCTKAQRFFSCKASRWVGLAALPLSSCGIT